MVGVIPSRQTVILTEAGIQILLSKIYFFFSYFSLTFINIGLTYRLIKYLEGIKAIENFNGKGVF
jgi:hypothetical protein